MFQHKSAMSFERSQIIQRSHPLIKSCQICVYFSSKLHTCDVNYNGQNTPVDGSKISAFSKCQKLCSSSVMKSEKSCEHEREIVNSIQLHFQRPPFDILSRLFRALSSNGGVENCQLNLPESINWGKKNDSNIPNSIFNFVIFTSLIVLRAFMLFGVEKDDDSSCCCNAAPQWNRRMWRVKNRMNEAEQTRENRRKAIAVHWNWFFSTLTHNWSSKVYVLFRFIQFC